MNVATALVASRLWGNLCGLVALLSVARAVAPSEIGLYAIASAIVFLPHGLVGAGFAEHVVARDPEGRDRPAAFYGSVLGGLCGSLPLLGVAGLAALGGHATIAWMILLLSPLPLMWSAGVVLEAVLIQEGRGRPLAAVLFGADLLGLLALFLVLAAGGGAFALVASRLAQTGAAALALLCIVPPPPRAAADRAAMRDIARFGAGMAGSRVSGWVNQFGADLVIGLVLSAEAVGLFRMGARLAQALAAITVYGPSAAQLTFLARHGSRARPAHAFLAALRLHLLLAAPVLVASAVLGPPLIVALLGTAWAPAASVFSILCLAMLPAIGANLATNHLVAAGRSRRVFGLHAIAAVATVAATLPAALAGLEAAALAKLGVGFGVLALALAATHELRPLVQRGVLLLAGRTLLACLAMAAASAAVLAALPEMATLPGLFAGLSLAGIVGLAVFLAAVRATGLAPHGMARLLRRRALRWLPGRRRAAA
jgi:O-antigen/teichoic acid export membrane protein